MVPLTDEQRTQIAEVRDFYEAKIAEQTVLHESAMRRRSILPSATRSPSSTAGNRTPHVRQGRQDRKIRRGAAILVADRRRLRCSRQPDGARRRHRRPSRRSHRIWSCTAAISAAGLCSAEVIDRIRALGWPGVYGNTDEALWDPGKADAYLAGARPGSHARRSSPSRQRSRWPSWGPIVSPGCAATGSAGRLTTSRSFTRRQTACGRSSRQMGRTKTGSHLCAARLTTGRLRPPPSAVRSATAGIPPRQLRLPEPLLRR